MHRLGAQPHCWFCHVAAQMSKGHSLILPTCLQSLLVNYFIFILTMTEAKENWWITNLNCGSDSVFKSVQSCNSYNGTVLIETVFHHIFSLSSEQNYCTVSETTPKHSAKSPQAHDRDWSPRMRMLLLIYRKIPREFIIIISVIVIIIIPGRT